MLLRCIPLTAQYALERKDTYAVVDQHLLFGEIYTRHDRLYRDGLRCKVRVNQIIDMTEICGRSRASYMPLRH